MTNLQLLTLILSIVIPLGGLALVQARALRQYMTQAETRLREDMRHLRADMHQNTAQLHQDMKELRGEVSHLRDRMAHLEGLLAGLREAITRQPAA